MTEFCPSCGAALTQGSPTCSSGCARTASEAPGGERPGAVRYLPMALVAIGLVVALVAVLLPLLDEGGGTAAAGEVFLEPVAAPGPDPFTEPVAPESTPPPSGVAPASGTAPPNGSAPYGGSGDDTVCDREAIVAFLTAQPDRAAAWAGVLGVAVADIPTYVRSLTPTVLLYDTRVTNHGFAAGRATPRQSVLQAGTAVLVDAAGDPVVRCRCGNPLRPPAPVSTPRTVGTPWPGYDPATLVEVRVGVTVQVSIEVTVQTTTSTTTTTATASTTPGGPVDPTVAEGLLAVLAECAPDATLQVLDIEPLEGFTGSFTITVDVGGTTMLFVYEPDTGTITEGDRASADLLTTCGVL